MKRTRLQSTVLWAALITFGILLIWLFGKYIFAGILPFLVAYPLSLIIRPVSSFIARKTRMKRNFCCVLLVILVIAFSLLLMGWLISTLIAESQGLLKSLITALEKDDNVLKRAFDYFSDLKNKVPFGGQYGTTADSIYNAILNTLDNSLNRITSALADLASGIIITLPKVIFSLITTVIALFYFSMDKGEISLEANKFLGTDLWKKIQTLKKRASFALKNYLKSYAIIMLITFAELFLGFVLMGFDFALLLAFLIAIVDVLPVLGAGTVIVPLGALYLITGEIKRGVGLIVLWLIMYLIRQITEPHILGSVMGVHPIISLFSIYMGFILFGVGGMLFLPLLVYVLAALVTEDSTPSHNKIE